MRVREELREEPDAFVLPHEDAALAQIQTESRREWQPRTAVRIDDEPSTPGSGAGRRARRPSTGRRLGGSAARDLHAKRRAGSAPSRGPRPLSEQIRMNGARRKARAAAFSKPLRTGALAASVAGLASVPRGTLDRLRGGDSYKATCDLQARKRSSGEGDGDTEPGLWCIRLPEAGGGSGPGWERRSARFSADAQLPRLPGGRWWLCSSRHPSRRWRASSRVNSCRGRVECRAGACNSFLALKNPDARARHRGAADVHPGRLGSLRH